MRNLKHTVTCLLAALVLSAVGSANADWLAADPGTPISLQVNKDGAFVVRPVGGAWTHAVCADVTAAEFSWDETYPVDPRHDQFTIELLALAAANGSRVNLFAEPERCDEHGHPVFHIVRIQGP